MAQASAGRWHHWLPPAGEGATPGRVWALAGALIALAVAAAALTIWLLYGYHHQRLRALAVSSSALAAEQAEAVFDAARFHVQAVRRELRFRQETRYWLEHPDELQTILTEISRLNADHGIADLAAIDPSGRKLALSYRPDARGTDVSDRPYFRALAAGVEQAVGDPTVSRAGGARMVPYAEWVKDQAGKPVFILGTSIDLNFLERLHASIVDDALAASALFKPGGTLVAGAWPTEEVPPLKPGGGGGWIVEHATVTGWPLVAVAGTPKSVIWRAIMLPSATVLAIVALLSAGIVLVTQIWQQRQRAYAALQRVEERQRVVVAELNHRVKNVLTLVQSIAAQTLRGSASLEEFERAFEGRLGALSRASTLLAVNSWRATALRPLAEAVLEPYRGGGTVRLDGPEVTLPSKAALVLSMALHELATNAAKYGALSVPGGRVEVTWDAVAAGGGGGADGAAPPPGEGRRLALTWVERGGPEVREPSERGFGCRMIERSVAYELDGGARLEFRPTGVSCRIELPLRDDDEPA